MNYPVQILGGTLNIHTTIDLRFTAAVDSLRLECGPFLLVVGSSPESRKALIAALLQADAELDAAVEKRKEVANA